MTTHLPVELWRQVSSFAGLSCASKSPDHGDCRAFARLALVSKAIYFATVTDRQRCVRVVTLMNTSTSFPTANARSVRVLIFVAQKQRYLGFGMDRADAAMDWRAQVAPFANIVWLDLSHMTNDRACAIIFSAARFCRHVRALVLPAVDPAERQYVGGLFKAAMEAMCRWRDANGGLRYLSIGQLVALDDRVLKRLRKLCPNLEVLLCPSTAILRRKWAKAWCKFWRTCLELRESNWPFPICTREDINQFAVVPKPQLTHLCLNGFNFKWAVDDPVAATLFVQTVPSLQCLRLEARPRRRVKPMDLLICNTLTQCPRLESVTVVGTSPRPGKWRYRPQPRSDIPLVTPRGLEALAGCRSVKHINIDRAVVDASTLGSIFKTSIESFEGQREIELTLIHCDRDILLAFLAFLKTFRGCELARIGLKMRMVNQDWRVGPHNRACDACVVDHFVKAVMDHDAHNADPNELQLSVRVDLRTPRTDFVSDRSGFLVDVIAVDINSCSGLVVGVFVDGAPVL